MSEPSDIGQPVKFKLFLLVHQALQEDPATGSAAAALAGFLASTGTFGNGPAKWVVEQGIELGRASLIDVEAVVTDGMSADIRVGGRIMVMGSGRIQASGPDPGPAAA